MNADDASADTGMESGDEDKRSEGESEADEDNDDEVECEDDSGDVDEGRHDLCGITAEDKSEQSRKHEDTADDMFRLPSNSIVRRARSSCDATEGAVGEGKDKDIVEEEEERLCPLSVTTGDGADSIPSTLRL